MGDPGQRTFYPQARQGGEYLAAIVEKEHVAALAKAARELLAGAGEALTPEDLLGGDLNLEPVQPEWRADALRMGAAWNWTASMSAARAGRFAPMAKQNHVWRQVAAAMAAREPAQARAQLAALASPPTPAVVEVAGRLCRSARADERRVGLLLVDELLAARPDLPEADALRAAAETARGREG